MSVSNTNSGFMQGSRKPQKVCDENKIKEEKMITMYNFFDGKKDYIWLYQKTGITDFDELQVNSSSHIKGTIRLVNG